MVGGHYRWKRIIHYKQYKNSIWKGQGNYKKNCFSGYESIQKLDDERKNKWRIYTVWVEILELSFSDVIYVRTKQGVGIMTSEKIDEILVNWQAKYHHK